MKLYYEMSEGFKPWNGAVGTYNRICEAGKLEDLEFILDELYPDGMSETGFNDLLWFEPETIYEWLGLRTESQVESDILDKKEEMKSLKDEFKEEVKEINSNRELSGMNEMNKKEREKLWESDYETDWDILKEELEELEEELQEVI